MKNRKEVSKVFPIVDKKEEERLRTKIRKQMQDEALDNIEDKMIRQLKRNTIHF